MKIFVLDTRSEDWPRISGFLFEQAQALLNAGDYLYVEAGPDRINWLERLLRDLGLEDNCCVLEFGEAAPADATRVSISQVSKNGWCGESRPIPR